LLHDPNETDSRLLIANARLADLNAELVRLVESSNEQQRCLELQKSELEAANTRLRELVTKDGLTGLTNHRTFQERLAA